MFLRHRPRQFQPQFFCIPTDKCENHRHIMNYQFNLTTICLVYYVWLVAWLNSGASALAIRHHLLIIGKFHGTSSEHRFYLQKVKKIKIKSHCPASFSEKKYLRNINNFFLPKKHLLSANYVNRIIY